jgi:Flp pilus assembly protein TadD
MAQMKIGRHDEAIAAAIKNTELRPNEQLSWSTLSICYVKNGQIKEAESAGGKARILSWGGKIKKPS